MADRLLVSEASVRHCIKDGDVRAIRIGKGWRVADSDLNSFLHKHATYGRDDATLLEGRDGSARPDKSTSI